MVAMSFSKGFQTFFSFHLQFANIYNIIKIIERHLTAKKHKFNDMTKVTANIFVKIKQTSKLCNKSFRISRYQLIWYRYIHRDFYSFEKFFQRYYCCQNRRLTLLSFPCKKTLEKGYRIWQLKKLFGIETAKFHCHTIIDAESENNVKIPLPCI